ncbi:hypothetical protein INN71_15210 [Nocardioides sp. ChNu-153]|uniref:hypothetical protein n=1 Tax=unclassified Nocardioides TaxID=2615069 RepID=UPI002406E5A1|nr:MULTISPECIES: hypothetical protein [unclassified Nocardioides]MDF9716300.1 hypothetical protein [Nocardioides sp. ChNu-99]MDN7122738.1 hypothetical protein [Nocardioides sp. ChNu-153]
MTTALVLDDVPLTDVVDDLVHHLVAAGEDVALVPTAAVVDPGRPWGGPWAEMVRSPGLPPDRADAADAVVIATVVALVAAGTLRAVDGTVAGTAAPEQALDVLRSAREPGVDVLLLVEPAPDETDASWAALAARFPAAHWLDANTGDVTAPGATPPRPAPTADEAVGAFDASSVEPWAWLPD